MSNESARPVNARTDAVDEARSSFNAPLWVVLGALALTALLYWPTSVEIADLWEDTVRRRYTHGWIVLAVTVWLVWRNRGTLASMALVPPRGGWLVVALGSLGWLVGLNAGLLSVTTLAMPLLVLATVWAVGGWALARKAAFPILFLYFAFPVWELISLPLQALTAFVSLWLTGMVGIPVRMDEFVIQIPEGWFEIAGGCNGLHFFIVALGIATLHGHLDKDDLRSRLLLLAIAGGLALVTNWLRVFIIIVAGHLTNMQHFLVRVDHYYFGWFLFAFALAFYVYVSSRVPRRARVTSLAESHALPEAQSRAGVAVALSTAALALGPAWSVAQTAGEGDVAALGPPTLEGWSGPHEIASDWRPVFIGVDEEWLATYRRAGAGEVALYRAAYHSQRQGKEIVGSGNSVLGPQYRPTAQSSAELIAQGTRIPVTEQVAVATDGDEVVTWFLFAIDGRPDPLNLHSRLAYGIRSLVAGPVASVIAVQAACRPDCANARATLQQFAGEVLPTMLAASVPARAGSAGHAN